MKRKISMLLFSILLIIGFFACNGNGQISKQTEDPDLILQSLQIYDQRASDLKFPSFTFGKDKASVTGGDGGNVIALFNYGSQTNKRVGVEVVGGGGFTRRCK